MVSMVFYLMCLYSPHWQSYGEVGWAYDFNNNVLQKQLRAKAGIQYEKLRDVFKAFGLYSALDISSYEESCWDINTLFQLGLISVNNERSWRFGIEYYDRRSSLGEFFQDKERYLGLGLWIDI